MRERLRELFQRIIKWQKTPVAPPEMSEEECICKNCGETFRSNYCPRCGQSANTHRLGSRSALHIFIDTWGLGRSGLLRTLWQLFTRPGYMIGDYLDGRRQFYFPPFKTLFVIGTAFALIYAISGGFSENAQNFNQKKERKEYIRNSLQNMTITMNNVDSTNVDFKEEQEKATKKLKDELIHLSDLFAIYYDWQERNYATDQLLRHIVFAFIACYIFRKSPRRPRMNFYENVIAQVYICAQIGTLAIISMLLSLAFRGYPTGDIPYFIVFIFFCYDFKQLFGYGIWRTLWKTFLMHIIYIGLIFTTLTSFLFIFVFYSLI